MIRHLVLTAPVPTDCVGMTFPAYRHLLDLVPAPRHLDNPKMAPIQPLAVGALADGEPVGLALAELPLEESGQAELLSLFVSKGWRRRGVGTSLVRAMEEEIAARGQTSVRAVYMTGKASIELVERILSRRGWQPPVTRMVSVRFTVDDIDRWPYLDRYPVRQGCEVFPWVELTDDERAELERGQAESGWIARDLQPWDHEERLEPITSVGMRCHGEVVGWVINHPISPTTLRFTCSYIRKDLGRRGRIVPLYCESFRRLKQTRYTSCTFTSPLYHPTMAAFAIKRCGPWASFVGETRGATKNLRPSVEIAGAVSTRQPPVHCPDQNGVSRADGAGNSQPSEPMQR